jgi:hypothetical protein
VHGRKYVDLVVCPVHLSEPSAAAIADLTKIIDRKTVVSDDLTNDRLGTVSTL